ncbi:MAG TPA: hypothetical protein VJS92_10200 [Candidatus Polarisedimenticolaceae bacterium]|nr:hypothetical protein [Candidatus Polarisedimenticolaceae bacterium]
MKRATLLYGFLICALAAAGTAASADSLRVGPNRTLGTVVSTDLGAGTLTVRVSEPEPEDADTADPVDITFVVAPGAKLRSADVVPRPLRLRDLRAGDRVVVVFWPRGGTPTAIVVERRG